MPPASTCRYAFTDSAPLPAAGDGAGSRSAPAVTAGSGTASRPVQSNTTTLPAPAPRLSAPADRRRAADSRRGRDAAHTRRTWMRGQLLALWLLLCGVRRVRCGVCGVCCDVSLQASAGCGTRRSPHGAAASSRRNDRREEEGWAAERSHCTPTPQRSADRVRQSSSRQRSSAVETTATRTCTAAPRAYTRPDSPAQQPTPTPHTSTPHHHHHHHHHHSHTARTVEAHTQRGVRHGTGVRQA